MPKRTATAGQWTPEKQRYLEGNGPVFAHNLQVFDPPIPAGQVQERGHLGYSIELSTPTLPAAPVPGLTVPGYLVRGPVPRVDEQPVVMPEPVNAPFLLRQPAEVLEAIGDFFPVVAAGPLPQKVVGMDKPVHGARFAVVFDAGRVQCLTGHLRHYIILKEPTCLRDEAMTVQYCPRWEPEQVMLSMDNLSAMVAPVISIRRGPTWRRELADALAYFRLLKGCGFGGYIRLLERMAQRHLTEVEELGVLGQIYDKHAVSNGIQARVASGLPLSPDERAAFQKAEAQNRYQVDHYPEVAVQQYREIGQRHPDLAGSALALYLAVCAFEDSRWVRDVGNLTHEALFSTGTRSRHRNKLRAFMELNGMV